MSVYEVESISELHKFMGLPKPKNPFFDGDKKRRNW